LSSRLSEGVRNGRGKCDKSLTNSGAGELRLTAIHGASRFNTEWLAGPDPAWSSKPTDD